MPNSKQTNLLSVKHKFYATSLNKTNKSEIILNSMIFNEKMTRTEIQVLILKKYNISIPATYLSKILNKLSTLGKVRKIANLNDCRRFFYIRSD